MTLYGSEQCRVGAETFTMFFPLLWVDSLTERFNQSFYRVSIPAQNIYKHIFLSALESNPIKFSSNDPVKDLMCYFMLPLFFPFIYFTAAAIAALVDAMATCMSFE